MSREYPCFCTVFAYSFYMQGKDGPPGQHGIPGVKGDEVKNFAICKQMIAVFSHNNIYL